MKMFDTSQSMKAGGVTAPPLATLFERFRRGKQVHWGVSRNQ